MSSHGANGNGNGNGNGHGNGNGNGNGRANGRVNGNVHAIGNGRANANGNGNGNGHRQPNYAEGVVDARLGRQALDVLEATIVLEAWTGAPARSAMSDAPDLVSSGYRPPNSKANLESDGEREQQSVVAEGITLVLSILSVAAWALPLGRAYGHHVLEGAIRLALPISVAIQWGLRSRYLGRRHGLAIFGRDAIAFCALALIAIKLPLVLSAKSGPIAVTLVAIWVGGTIIARRGWGLLYAITLVAATVALDRREPATLVLGSLVAFTTFVSVVAVLTRRQSTDEVSGSVPRALLATLLGGCVGGLLVADPTLGWGVRGIHPAVSLIPSVIGSFWGGYYLWNLHEVIPRGLSGTPLDKSSSATLRGPAMAIFLGATARLLGTTVVLSLAVMLLGRWTHGTDATSLFFAFGGVALLSLLLSLLESLSLSRSAVLAAVAALGAELAWHPVAAEYGIHWNVSGAALVVGVSVGVLVALPPLIFRLVRSGNVLATTLWIH